MPVQQQFKVSNPSDGVVVVTPDPGRPKAYLRFEAKGDELGGDSLYLSREQAQQPDFVKAVQRGLLLVEVKEDDELYHLLRSTAKRKKTSSPQLTVMNVDFDETDDYRPKTTEVKVTVDPLMKG